MALAAQANTGEVLPVEVAWIPTLLGMITLVLGAFLVVPATANTALPAAATVAFLVQVRMEEEHLTWMHGTACQAYRASVPRCIDLSR